MSLVRVSAVLSAFLAAGLATGQCVTNVQQVPSAGNVIPGPVAWSGRVLAVAGTHSDTTRVFFATFDSTGNQLSPITTIPDSEGVEVVDIVWNGSEFTLFLENAAHELILRRISIEGALIGGPIRRYRLTIGDDDQLAIMWSAIHSRYLIARIARDDREGVWLSTLEADGDLEFNVRIDDVGETSPLAIAMTETGTIGVFYQEDKGDFLMMQIAEPSRTVGRPQRVWRVAETLSVVSKGNWFVLVRSKEANVARDSVQWKFVDTSGNDVLAEEQIAQIANVPDARPLAFISTTEGFALSYLDRASGTSDLVLRLRRLDLDGDVIADTEFGPPSRRQNNLVVDDFIFTGQTYIALAGHEEDLEHEAYVVTWCPLRARIEAPRTAKPGETVTFTAVAEGGVSRYAYVWDIGEFSKEGRVLEYTFTQPGSYVVTLTVRDDTFTRVAETFTIEVIADVPEQPGSGKRRSVRK